MAYRRGRGILSEESTNHCAKKLSAGRFFLDFATLRAETLTRYLPSSSFNIAKETFFLT